MLLKTQSLKLTSYWYFNILILFCLNEETVQIYVEIIFRVMVGNLSYYDDDDGGYLSTFTTSINYILGWDESNENIFHLFKNILLIKLFYVIK